MTTEKMKADTTLGNTGDWQGRHDAAVTVPRKGHERALQQLISGWLEYAEAHKAMCGDTVGNDGVLGDHWKAIGEGIHGLLDGESGRFDCGTFSTLIHATAKANDAEIDG